MPRIDWTCSSDLGTNPATQYEGSHQKKGEDSISRHLDPTTLVATTPSQPAIELPLPGTERQADPAPHQAQREEISSQMAEEEVVPLGPGTTPTDRPENGPERTTTPHNQSRPREDEGRPRREVRKPIRYQDYECYTLQLRQECLLEGGKATKGRNYEEKELNSKKGLGKKELENLGQSGVSNRQLDQSGTLRHLDQSGASKHRQTTPPSWPCVQLNSEAV